MQECKRPSVFNQQSRIHRHGLRLSTRSSSNSGLVSWARGVQPSKSLMSTCEPRNAKLFGQLRENFWLVCEDALLWNNQNVVVNGKKPNNGTIFPDTVIMCARSVILETRSRRPTSQLIRWGGVAEGVLPENRTFNTSVSCFCLYGGRYTEPPNLKFPALCHYSTSHYYVVLTPLEEEQPCPYSIFS